MQEKNRMSQKLSPLYKIAENLPILSNPLKYKGCFTDVEENHKHKHCSETVARINMTKYQHIACRIKLPADDILRYFFLTFYQKTSFDFSCKLSPSGRQFT